MSFRSKATALVVATVVVGGMAVSTTPASASAAGGVVHGTGSYADDWHDEGPISTSRYSYSNVAAAWQAILWADGLLEWSGIDCRFGSGTATATRNWQARNNLPADGIVGEQTFRVMNARLESAEYAGTHDYIGRTSAGLRTGRNVHFVTNAEGRWGMYIGNDLRTLWYNDATFNVC